MRTEEQIIAMILSVAEGDERIRAVILNGSRTNKNIVKDDFQDFDVVFLVEDISSYKNDQGWIDIFGERIILQMPNSMQFDEPGLEVKQEELTYLMLFKDFNRIDLNLVEVKKKDVCSDSLNKVLLDKDSLFEKTNEPNDKDYLIRKPSQKEFFDCCNEFWWVTTYVVKGLVRDEPLYAKEMLEIPVRRMFMKMLAWHVGAETGFSINLGKHNRFLKNHLRSSLWARILKTFPDSDNQHIWNSLLEMTIIFHEIGLHVADKLGLKYNSEEALNVKEYLQKMENRVMKFFKSTGNT